MQRNEAQLPIRFWSYHPINYALMRIEYEQILLYTLHQILDFRNRSGRHETLMSKFVCIAAAARFN